VRATNPAPPLEEHLTQIITIVSSIVAVCNDSVPFEGRAILQELSEHCDRLSEVQTSLGGSGNTVPSKETRQVVAKSSFAVANAVKSLMKL
jgi:protein SPA2